MRTTIALSLIAAAALCSAAMAQTSVPAKQRFDLRVVQMPGGTLYLNGTRPLVKKSPKGLTSYAYKHGRPAIILHSDGSYAELKYENGKLDHIAYSDGTVRRAGDKLAPSVGGSIAARGGTVPMNYTWDGDWGRDDWDNGYFYQYDDGGRRGGDWGGDWDVGGNFPGEQPNNPWKRMKCLADAYVTLKAGLTEVCPMMQDQSVCISQAMKLHDELLKWCMG